ncbi:RIBC2 family protein [Megaselia abdita]
MLKFPITTNKDLEEAAILEKRRQFEEERRKRIFNAKQRLFGLDYDTLEKQKQEKNQQRQAEAAREEKFLEEARRQDYLIRTTDQLMEKQKKQIAADINTYRKLFQGVGCSRERDLNDPEMIKKERPVRIADNDPRLGISSAQVFEGEDLTGGERKRQQKEQQRAWLEQQIKERKQAELDRKNAEQVILDSLQARDRQLVEIDQIQRSNKDKMQEAVMKFNQKLATEKEIEKKLERQRTNEDNLAEIYNMLGSDMLTENPNCADSPLGAHKKIAYMYRGMNEEERIKFRQDQMAQIEKDNQRKTQDFVKEREWEEQQTNNARLLILKQMEMDKLKKKLITENKVENLELAKEQNDLKNFLNKKVYVNEATNEFYDKFNTTSR